MEEYDIDRVPAKLADTRCFIRLNEGNMQLIRVEPLYNDNGIMIPISVWMYVDEEPGVLMDRVVMEMMTMAYTPLESISLWKGEIH